MPRFLVLTPNMPAAHLLGAIQGGNIRVLGEWDFPDNAGEPDVWLPEDPDYAYVDVATGTLRMRCNGDLRAVGNLVGLLGFTALDLALDPVPPPGSGPGGHSPRKSVDIVFPQGLENRLIARAAIKAVLPHLTDQDIEDFAREKRFALTRAEIVAILVNLLKEIWREDRYLTVHDVIQRMDPLAEGRRPAWMP